MKICSHPERPVYNKGLCKSCYNSQWKPTKEQNLRRNSLPAAKARKRKWMDKQDPNWCKDQHRYNRYGIIKADYESMLFKQSNRCKICLVDFKEKRPNIDHDHKTGKVRALLCLNCNAALGMIQESEFKLARLIAYLKWSGSIQTDVGPWAYVDFVDLRAGDFQPSNDEQSS